MLLNWSFWYFVNASITQQSIDNTSSLCSMGLWLYALWSGLSRNFDIYWFPFIFIVLCDSGWNPACRRPMAIQIFIRCPAFNERYKNNFRAPTYYCEYIISFSLFYFVPGYFLIGFWEIRWIYLWFERN